jgi:hypothetical protein
MIQIVTKALSGELLSDKNDSFASSSKSTHSYIESTSLFSFLLSVYSKFPPMPTTITETRPKFTKLILRNRGTVTRDVSTTEPRAASLEEIPVIDLSKINGSLSDCRSIASKKKEAASTSAFFYISNHGIEEIVIQNAAAQCTSSVYPKHLILCHIYPNVV